MTLSGTLIGLTNLFLSLTRHQCLVVECCEPRSGSLDMGGSSFLKLGVGSVGLWPKGRRDIVLFVTRHDGNDSVREVGVWDVARYVSLVLYIVSKSGEPAGVSKMSSTGFLGIWCSWARSILRQIVTSKPCSRIHTCCKTPCPRVFIRICDRRAVACCSPREFMWSNGDRVASRHLLPGQH